MPGPITSVWKNFKFKLIHLFSISFLKTTAEQQVWNIPEYLQLVLPFIYLFFLFFFPVSLKEKKITIDIYHFKSLPADWRTLSAVTVIVNQLHKYALSVSEKWDYFMSWNLQRYGRPSQTSLPSLGFHGTSVTLRSTGRTRMAINLFCHQFTMGLKQAPSTSTSEFPSTLLSEKELWMCDF